MKEVCNSFKNFSTLYTAISVCVYSPKVCHEAFIEVLSHMIMSAFNGDWLESGLSLNSVYTLLTAYIMHVYVSVFRCRKCIVVCGVIM